MSDHRTFVGSVELVSLSDGQGDGDPTDIFPDSTIGQWRSEFPELLDEHGRIHPRYGSVAARSQGRTIVVDTGLGGPGGRLPADMAARGVDTGSVDLVVLTHLHGDHVGWNLTDGRPTFPNARYLVPRLDWEYWTQPAIARDNPPIPEQVVPLEEHRVMDLIDGEYSITDELTALPTPGHTPGHVSIAISSGGRRGFILGDVAHSPAQARHTDWNPVFDIDPGRARETRHRVLDRLEADGSLVSSGHFPGPGFGRFARRGGRRVWQGI